MECKIIEIRDRITYIAVLATKMQSQDEAEKYHLWRAGYVGSDGLSDIVLVTRLDNNRSEINANDWDSGSRTMVFAHEHIAQHFDELNTGDVVDVEFILGEVAAPKISERLG